MGQATKMTAFRAGCTLVGIVGTIIAALFVLSRSALPHEHSKDGAWIGKANLHDPKSGDWCCNENDCDPVPADGLAEEFGGYRIKVSGELWPDDRVLWKTPDGRWWRCRHTFGEKIGLTRCLLGPPPNS